MNDEIHEKRTQEVLRIIEEFEKYHEHVILVPELSNAVKMNKKHPGLDLGIPKAKRRERIPVESFVKVVFDNEELLVCVVDVNISGREKEYLGFVANMPSDFIDINYLSLIAFKPRHIFEIIDKETVNSGQFGQITAIQNSIEWIPVPKCPLSCGMEAECGSNLESVLEFLS
jgi:hypothetical protein